jgi:hypothetical protein
LKRPVFVNLSRSRVRVCIKLLTRAKNGLREVLARSRGQRWPGKLAIVVRRKDRGSRITPRSHHAHRHGPHHRALSRPGAAYQPRADVAGLAELTCVSDCRTSRSRIVHRHGPHRRPPPGAAFQPVAGGDDLAGRACANELTARQLARASHTAPHERRAFHSLFRAWPAAAAAAACDHAASGAELTFATDYCIEISEQYQYCSVHALMQHLLERSKREREERQRNLSGRKKNLFSFQSVGSGATPHTRPARGGVAQKSLGCPQFLDSIGSPLAPY